MTARRGMAGCVTPALMIALIVQKSARTERKLRFGMALVKGWKMPKRALDYQEEQQVITEGIAASGMCQDSQLVGLSRSRAAFDRCHCQGAMPGAVA